MQKPNLDYSSFEKAHASLASALAVIPIDDIQTILKRDAVIQRFEYTYELSHKMLKRFLEAVSPSPETVDQLDFRDLLRLGAEMGLIDDVQQWFVFRDKRNITSHAYDEAKAKEVFDAIPSFVEASGRLLSVLKQRSEPSV